MVYAHSEKRQASLPAYRASGRALAAVKKYQATEKGKAKIRAYEQTEECKERRKAFGLSERGKALSKLRQYRFMQTAKGRACRVRHKNTWYGKRNILIYDLKQSCACCGEMDKLKLTGDHIVPRAAGGTDDWDNLQVLCKECHKLKTAVDYKKYHWAGQIPAEWF